MWHSDNEEMDKCKNTAFDLNICGWIKNLEDGKVEIIAEGESKNIQEFSDKIKIRKYPVFVEVKEILQGVREDTSHIREDKSIQLLETIREDTSDMKSTLKDTKFSLSSFIEEKFKKQEMEIAEIKATLARIQAAE